MGIEIKLSLENNFELLFVGSHKFIGHQQYDNEDLKMKFHMP